MFAVFRPRRQGELRGRDPLSSVSRKLLPDGSRNDASIPYGCSVGGSTNSTPRAETSS